MAPKHFDQGGHACIEVRLRRRGAGNVQTVRGARRRVHTSWGFSEPSTQTAGCFTRNMFLDCMILLHLGPCSSAACVEAVDRTCFAQSACSGSTCRGTRGRARHASAAPTRRALPVAQSIRLALRLHALAPKVAGPDHRCWRLLSTPRGGSSVRLRAPTSRAGGDQRVLPRRLDLCGVEEVPGEVGAQRELEAAHGRQRRGLGPRL